jgi:arylsulfatase A
MRNKSFRVLLSLLLLTSLAIHLQAETKHSLPNVIIIFTDDQGYGDVGVFGAKGFTTPNLDRLAREGCRFSNFHVSSPVCSASRSSLLTGCYPTRVGINGALSPSVQHGLSTNEVTIAKLLKQKGYATGMAGKWHLGHLPAFLPMRHGFDEYYGLPYSNDMWPLHPEAKPGAYPPLPLIEGDRAIKLGLDHKDQEQLTTFYTERAVKFIEKNKDKPFFFYLAHSMPHVPLHVSDKFRGKSKQGLYGDVIMEIDWSVGEVMKALKKNGIEKNTLVIFTSDNGPWLSYGNHAGSAGPLREGKGTCWEGGTRTPCIMRWPGVIPTDTVNDRMFMTIDLLPTIASYVGAELPSHKIDGLNVLPILKNEKNAINPHAAYFFWYERAQLQSVLSGDGRWKLQLPHTYRTLNGRPGGKDGVPVRYSDVKLLQPELYDLQQDLGERVNVTAEQGDIVERLLSLAEGAREELGDSITGREGTGNRGTGTLSGNKAR